MLRIEKWLKSYSSTQEPDSLAEGLRRLVERLGVMPLAARLAMHALPRAARLAMHTLPRAARLADQSRTYRPAQLNAATRTIEFFLSNQKNSI